MDIFTLSGLDPTAGAAPPRPAGLPRRLAALAYDAVLLAALLAMLTLLVLALRGGRAIEPGTVWFVSLLLLAIYVFFAYFWTHGGQTLGMTAWRIELRSVAGEPVSLRQASVRFVAAWLSLLAGGLGFAWAALDPQGRAWHDRLAGTWVVRADRPGAGTAAAGTAGAGVSAGAPPQ